MHILYEIEHLSTSGGIERILTDKANYMVEEWGWDVTIVVLLDEEQRPFFPLSSKVRTEYLHVKSKGTVMCLQALWRLNRIVNRIKPDFCVTVQTIGALSCLFRTHRVPTIYEAHGTRNYMPHPFALNFAERFANVIVALTKKNAKRYSKAKDVVVIPNFTKVCNKQIIDYSKKHCVALGRLHEVEKNFSRMIDIWSRVHPTHPDWLLDIYGDGPDRELLQQRIDSLGLSGNVILHGQTNSIDSAFQTASICLLTSNYESFGIVLIEAGLFGLPCLSFDCPDGPREIIVDGENGYLISNNDVNSYAERLMYLMDNEPIRERMGLMAEHNAERFSEEKIMEKWLLLFKKIYNCDKN